MVQPSLLTVHLRVFAFDLFVCIFVSSFALWLDTRKAYTSKRPVLEYGYLTNTFHIACTIEKLHLLGTPIFQKKFLNIFTVISVEEIILIRIYYPIKLTEINTWTFHEILNRNWRIRQVKVDSSNNHLFHLEKCG